MLGIQNTGSHPPLSRELWLQAQAEKRANQRENANHSLRQENPLPLLFQMLKPKQWGWRSKVWKLSWHFCSEVVQPQTFQPRPGQVLHHFQALFASCFYLPVVPRRQGTCSRSNTRSRTAPVREILSFASKVLACWHDMIEPEIMLTDKTDQL